MSDRCPTCLRPRVYGAAFDPTQHCPRELPAEYGSNIIACLAIGFEKCEAQLAATKAKLDRAQLLLVKARDALDLALAETQQRPGDEEGGANG